MSGQAILVVMTDIDPENEDELNTWYNEEHIPLILAVPGVLTARRYRAVEGQPKYLALYDVVDVRVLEQPEYLRITSWGPDATPRARRVDASYRNLSRGIYQHILTLPSPEPADLSPARAVLLVGLEIEPAHDQEFNDWYDMEHLPALSQVPGVVRARRYKLYAQGLKLRGTPTTYVALYDLERREVLASDDWSRRSTTPWAERVRRFFTRRIRNVYERIVPA